LKLKCDKLLSSFAFNFNLRHYIAGAAGGRALPGPRGRAVQVDPIKPTLKAPGTKRLKLKHDEPLSTFAFKINLRRYNVACFEGAAPRIMYSRLQSLTVSDQAAPEAGCLLRTSTRPTLDILPLLL
jgi:hypothetical protein